MTSSTDSNNFINSAVGITAGYSTYIFGPSIIKKPYMEYCMKSIKSLSASECDTFWKAANKVLADSGLDKKGVKIESVNNYNFIEIANDIIKNSGLKKNKSNTKLSKWITEKIDNKMFKHIVEIAEGKNACFVKKTKQILVNKEKMSFSTFHELGHAINNTGNGFKKYLSKSRNYIALGAPIILFASLLSGTAKHDKNSNDNKKGSFIKRNCGILAGLCLVPKVIEEGLASLNGQKLAKKVLNADMYKKVVSLNKKAFGSYVLGAVLTGCFTQFAVYIKDRICSNR